MPDYDVRIANPESGEERIHRVIGVRDPEHARELANVEGWLTGMTTPASKGVEPALVVKTAKHSTPETTLSNATKSTRDTFIVERVALLVLLGIGCVVLVYGCQMDTTVGQTHNIGLLTQSVQTTLVGVGLLLASVAGLGFVYAYWMLRELLGSIAELLDQLRDNWQ